MRLMRRALVLLLVLVAAIGCQQQAMTGGKPRPKGSHTVVSLAPGTTELATAFGSTYNLLGRTQACNYPVGVEHAPVVATTKPDYEKISSINPEVILYDSTLYSPGDIQKLQSLGPKLVEVKGDTVDQFIQCLFPLGKALHNESKMSEYADNILAARNGALADPLPKEQKVAMVMTSDKGLGYVAASGSFQADCGRAAGANIVGPQGNAFLPVNVEAFLQMNPDIIVVAVSRKDADKDIQALLSDPQLQGLNAIKAKRIVPVDGDVLLRRGSRVDKLIDSLHRSLKKVSQG